MQRWLVLWVVSASLLACGTERPDRPARAVADRRAPLPRAPEPQSGTPIGEQMGHHFEDATRARDALVRGDLGAAQSASRELADTEPGAGLPMPYFEAMQRASRRVADAPDLDAATRAFGDVARSCGTCHEAAEAHIEMSVVPPPAGDDARSQMQRHSWAADRLWEGIVLPDAERFSDGVGVLVDVPLDPSALLPGEAVDPEVEALASRVHELALRATGADDDASQAALYGDLLRTCADCHRLLEVRGPHAPVAL